ncbi:MAG: asparaginase [Gorillibacterium sp.]|nr:asparaginase [Gorillibacterium sp.]
MIKQQVIKIYRGELVESTHLIHIAVTDSAGSLLYSVGNPERITYCRSSAKPLQAISVVESGVIEHFGLTEAELALICASHNGEEYHVRHAAGILAKLNLTEKDLQCGAHYPYYAPAMEALKAENIAPRTLHNNCSGKHAGMLALALMIGAKTEGYPLPQHPVQQRMLTTISTMSNIPIANITLGIDGCGVPVFALPLRALAYAYARLGQPQDLSVKYTDACDRITSAIRKHPFALAGTDRFDTRLIEVTQGRLIGKLGAEGVFAVTAPAVGLGIAVKVEDGSLRALYPAVAEALHQLDLLSVNELTELADFHHPYVTNWQGTRVGQIIPEFLLSKLF